MAVHAAALAYHVLISLFPFALFLLALLSFFELPGFFDWLKQQALAFLPEPAMKQVDMVILELQLPQKGLLSTGAATALWLASSGVRALMVALNVAYAARESRPAWKRYPLSIFYTLGIAAMLIAAAALMIVGPRAMQWLAHQIGLETIFVMLWTWLRLPTALLLASLAVAIVYYLLPNVPHRFQLITAGSVLAIVTWIGASLAFGYYVKNFANYSVMYGSIGAVIVLLLYLYISAAALLFGAEINAVIEHHAPSRQMR
ncbi:MAG: YihY/virulence factor BrkB family protein [Pseudomonadota bacterium]